jgi:hypothetical protein
MNNVWPTDEWMMYVIIEISTWWKICVRSVVLWNISVNTYRHYGILDCILYRSIPEPSQNTQPSFFASEITRNQIHNRQLTSYKLYMGHAVPQWLRHRATNWKVAGSIPDCAIRIFHWHNSSDRTMTLGSTQPLTEMSTRNISWG